MPEVKKRGRGRPRKSEIQRNSVGGRGKVGRPKGDAAIINEYKARMLASPKSKAVLEKVLDLALLDEHPDAQACRKLVWDKVLPASYFEKDRLSGKSPSIDININLGDKTPSVSASTDDAVDVEFEHVEDRDGEV